MYNLAFLKNIYLKLYFQKNIDFWEIKYLIA